MLIGVAAAWNAAAMHRLGKLPEAAAFAPDFLGNAADQGFEDPEVAVEDGLRDGRLRGSGVALVRVVGVPEKAILVEVAGESHAARHAMNFPRICRT